MRRSRGLLLAATLSTAGVLPAPSLAGAASARQKMVEVNKGQVAFVHIRADGPTSILIMYPAQYQSYKATGSTEGAYAVQDVTWFLYPIPAMLEAQTVRFVADRDLVFDVVYEVIEERVDRLFRGEELLRAGNGETRREALRRIFWGVVGAGVCFAHGSCARRRLESVVESGADLVGASRRRREYPKVALVGENGEPMRACSLQAHETFVFLYPFSNTPAFLLDLGVPVIEQDVEAEGTGPYRFPGGAGPGRSIVAYTAICPHQQVHPTPELSLISYYPPGAPSVLAGRDSVITCCAHGSVFDPLRAGRVLQSPAEYPLASVQLEWDEKTDALYACGVAGKDSFEQFFNIAGRGSAVSEKTTVVPLEGYSGDVARC